MICSYLLLFGSAFLAATILPFSSEIVLFALLREGGNPVSLVGTASLGNTLGAVVNWALGRYLPHYQDRRQLGGPRLQGKPNSAGPNGLAVRLAGLATWLSSVEQILHNQDKSALGGPR